MATDDLQRLVTGTSPTPAHFMIPGNGQMRPKAIFATYDGSGGAALYQPALKIISDAGKTVGIYPTDTTVAAGGSADVSWFPRVAGIPRSSAVLPGTSVSRLITSQTITNNATANIVFDTVLFDDLNWFNPLDPSHITPSISGQFLCTYTNAWIYPGIGGFAIQTGITVTPPTEVVVSEQISAVAGTPNATSGPGIVNATAGESFALFLFQNSGVDQKTWIPGSAGTDIQPVPILSVVRIGDRV